MTREEAISEWTFRSNHIKKWLDEYGEEPSIRHYVELIDMAIEALSEPSKVDFRTDKSANIGTEVNDLISRADVHKTLSLLATEGGADAKMLLMDAHEFIDALPSAELTLQTPQTYCKSINPSNAEVVEDYISRADALMELNGVCSNWEDDAKVAEIIHTLPSADTVPIEKYRELQHCYVKLAATFAEYLQKEATK